MRLISNSLRSRAFLLQFISIINEFGKIIPWLEPLKGLEHSTNSQYFRDEFLSRVGCDEQSVIPYQFVTSDRSHGYIGGIIFFHESPESFKDFRNIETALRLRGEGWGYITCLQVINIHRGAGHGTAIMRRSLAAILKQYHKVWGVISEYDLLDWYVKLGAKLQSPMDNKDKLWIISFEDKEI